MLALFLFEFMSKNLFKILAILILTLNILSHSASSSEETEVVIIKLASPLDEPDIEISGLAWCGELLILLPQYPERFTGSNRSYFYTVSKSEILSYLNSSSRETKLRAQKLLVYENEIRDRMSFFEGFEAIACEDNVIWLSIEAQNLLGTHQAYVVPAELDLAGSTPNISVRTDQIRYIKSQSGIHNKGEEAIVLHGEHLVSLHEVYDQRAVAFPKANRVNRVTGEQSSIDISHLPYRLTDATSVDEDNRFWVINYQYSGDRFARGANDPLATEYGKGTSHKRFYNTERLVEYQFKNDRIERTKEAPIQLLMTSKEGRNWEGIVRLDDMGFLIATDKHPKTIFGFVPVTR